MPCETSNLPAPMTNQKFRHAEMIDREVLEDMPPQRGCIFENFRAGHLCTAGTTFFGSARLADAKFMSIEWNGQDLGGELNSRFFGFLGARSARSALRFVEK